MRLGFHSRRHGDNNMEGVPAGGAQTGHRCGAVCRRDPVPVCKPPWGTLHMVPLQRVVSECAFRGLGYPLCFLCMYPCVCMYMRVSVCICEFVCNPTFAVLPGSGHVDRRGVG